MPARIEAFKAPCPTQELHQWHPRSYIAHSAWADDTLLIADQRRCPGCKGWVIWTPKRSDLRPWGADWTSPTCIGSLAGGGACTKDAICERLIQEEAIIPAVWWPVCYDHTGLPTVTG